MGVSLDKIVFERRRRRVKKRDTLKVVSTEREEEIGGSEIITRSKEGTEY